jgi:hypothetical protein
VPQILSTNDPALVATLASQASGYRVWHDQQELGLQASQLAGNQNFEQQRLALERQRLAQSFTGQGGQPQQPQSPGGSEILPNGATIYHPAGDGFYPQQQAAGGRGGGNYGGGGGEYSLGGVGQVPGLYLSPLQKQHNGIIDQMEQAGQLGPAEAMRWRALVAAGHNPFTEQTTSEQSDLLKQRQALRQDPKTTTAYQEQELSDRLSKENDQLDKDSYDRQRHALNDQLESVNKRYAAATATAERKDLAQQASALEKKLADLPNSYTKPTPRTRAAPPAGGSAGGSATATTAAAAPAAGGSATAASVDPKSPITPDDVTFLVQKYGSAAKARAAAFAGERAPKSATPAPAVSITPSP